MVTNFTKIAVGLRSDHMHSGTLDAAANLSKVFQCSLHLICFDDNCSVYEQMIAEKAKSGSVHFEIERRSNESVKEIVKAAKELEAELLIVPSDKKTQSIVNDMEIPVLSVKDDFNPRPIKKIVMPLHDKPDTRQKIPMGAEIAKHFNAEIFFVVVTGKGNEEQNRLNSYAEQAVEWCEKKFVKAQYEMVVGSKVDEETIKYATKIEADLIIIMNDRDISFFSMQLSEKIIRNSPIPVLTVEPKDIGARTMARL